MLDRDSLQLGILANFFVICNWTGNVRGLMGPSLLRAMGSARAGTPLSQIICNSRPLLACGLRTENLNPPLLVVCFDQLLNL